MRERHTLAGLNLAILYQIASPEAGEQPAASGPNRALDLPMKIEFDVAFHSF